MKKHEGSASADCAILASSVQNYVYKMVLATMYMTATGVNIGVKGQVLTRHTYLLASKMGLQTKNILPVRKPL